MPVFKFYFHFILLNCKFLPITFDPDPEIMPSLAVCESIAPIALYRRVGTDRSTFSLHSDPMVSLQQHYRTLSRSQCYLTLKTRSHLFNFYTVKFSQFDTATRKRQIFLTVDPRRSISIGCIVFAMLNKVFRFHAPFKLLDVLFCKEGQVNRRAHITVGPERNSRLAD